MHERVSAPDGVPAADREPASAAAPPALLRRYVGPAAMIAAIASLLWLTAGPAWAWAFAALSLAALLVHHLREVAALVTWLRSPALDSIPSATGIWDEAYAGLYRMLRRQHHSTSRLAATLEDFRRAGEAMPDGLVILAEDDRIEWCNPKAEQHFGLDERRDRHQSITYLVRQPRFAEYLQAARYQEPLVLRQTRTGDRILAVQLVPYGDRQKLIISRDITDLERVETMRRDFIANVSHELRTPLTVLCGFLETLTDAQANERSALLGRSLPLMLTQARRMERLVADLLALSQLESANDPVRQERVNAPALVRALYEDAVALSAGRHRLLLEVTSSVGLLGSEDELRSAFSNLISNAVRYTPEGGTVTLIWEDKDGEAVFSVRDTGIGVDPLHIPRLTERFYRVDRSRSRETGGTGLGLAIVKHVLQRHQGVLEISSEPGRGSTFSAVFRGARVVDGGKRP